MGLFNHLFGGKKGLAKELLLDDKKRMELWEEHLGNFGKRNELVKNFRRLDIDVIFEKPDEVERVLQEIEGFISSELVHIEDEEKNDEEILEDIEDLPDRHGMWNLTTELRSVKKKEEKLLELFHNLYKVLRAELHLIRLYRKKHLKEYLKKLFDILFFREAYLIQIFERDSFYIDNQDIHNHITNVARAILLEQKIEEAEETAAEIFAKKMVKEMHSESRHAYRKLGEEIFDALTERQEVPIEDVDEMLEAIERMIKEIDDDELMFSIVKKLRKSFNKMRIEATVLAFREAIDIGHFEDNFSDFNR